MKDALGHGSNGFAGNSSGRIDFMRSNIGIAPGATFKSAARPDRKLTTDEQVSALRNRLATPKQGFAHAFLQGVKNALGV
jgi:hypothetical protein